jgi:hypothetical protein
MGKTIPDLRDDHDQITLDHCYVLLTRLTEALDTLEGSTGKFADIIENFDPSIIQEDLQKYLDAPEFSRLFKSDFGKGVLVGFYVKALWIKMKGDPDEQDYEG